MDTPQISAPSRAPSRVPRRVTAFGVIHVNAIHTTRFTIVGNHLAQHRQLSLTAIGLAVHIQSLPEGAKADIKTLADRFPESEARIAAALRELEAHSYLARTLVRIPGGRLVTRTVSYNHPEAAGSAQAAPSAPPPPEPRPAPAAPAAPATEPPPPPPPAPDPEPATVPPAEAEPSPAPAPSPTPKPPRPPLPQPLAPDPERQRIATDLLAGLRRDEPRLLLGERDVRRLAPAVAAWLEREATPDAVRRALTADLPHPLKQPAGLLAHRLTALLPPQLPDLPAPDVLHPLHDCTGTCKRVIRAPEPGLCRDCRAEARSRRGDALAA
ncbi:helix-turn-helix domain-containing protein [Streptomyces genisteinicus]|uniref:Helix-turn-helix domain-containing protein n=1 Tax=Streptomyces genisteinicus TaxID=2768068 RepID=A0A7H0HSV6_9ACTN|nr:helix-turn-helix domain-containing protein [Streptomyces genisteinicus]QNP63622.1 helix-turn-helix domain-containing protein [Streptomyces genisteinicus]